MRNTERKIKMKEQNEKLRTTIYIDEELVKRAEILFGEAKVNSFSAFASKAIEAYITKLVIDKNGTIISMPSGIPDRLKFFTPAVNISPPTTATMT